MVAHAAHGVVALVVAAGDHRHIADVEGVEERSALPVGGLDANYPVLASRLWAGGPDVAPHAEKQPIRRGAAYLLHGIALGNGPNVQPEGGVGDLHGGGGLINDDRREVGVASGLRQSGGVGEGGGGGIADASLPGVMPQGQHAPQGGIDLAAGALAEVPAEEKQVDDFAVHNHGRPAGGVVYRLEVDHAVIVAVDVVELVVLQQRVMEGLGGGLKVLLTLRIAHHGGHGVKEGEKGGLIPLRTLLLRRGRGCAAGQQEDGQKQGEQATHLRPLPFPPGSGSRPRRW